MNFEEQLKHLEHLAESIKDSDIPLEKALSLFEEGISLSRSLEKDLDKIEGKIQMLMNAPDVPATDDSAESKTPAPKKRKKDASSSKTHADSAGKPEFDLFSME